MNQPHRRHALCMAVAMWRVWGKRGGWAYFGGRWNRSNRACKSAMRRSAVSHASESPSPPAEPPAAHGGEYLGAPSLGQCLVGSHHPPVARPEPDQSPLHHKLQAQYL